MEIERKKLSPPSTSPIHSTTASAINLMERHEEPRREDVRRSDDHKHIENQKRIEEYKREVDNMRKHLFDLEREKSILTHRH
jgi:hypothetical protein